MAPVNYKMLNFSRQAKNHFLDPLQGSRRRGKWKTLARLDFRPIFPDSRLPPDSNDINDITFSRQVGGRRPPIRTGLTDLASPVLSSVSTSAAHKVPSPSAGVRRSPGIFLMKRRTAPSFFMPITES